MKKEHMSSYAIRNYLAKRTKGQPRGPKPATMKLMKTVAERVVNKELETKFVVVTQSGVNFNSIIASSGEFYTMLPAVAQAPAGTVPADYQRVGNNISPISCKTHFTVSLYPRVQSVDIIVVLYCLRRKQNRNFVQLLADVTGVPQILRTGQAGDTSGFTGILTDTQLPLNTDEYTLITKKIIRLAKNVGLPNIDATTGNSPNISGMGSKSFTVSVKLPKTLCYKPGSLSASYPENDAPFWCLGYAHADGTSGGDVAFTDVNVSYTTQMYYKDA